MMLQNTQDTIRSILRRQLKRGIALRYRLLPVDPARKHRARVAGFRLEVWPEVFHPGWYFTSAFMAKTILRGKAIGPGMRVLEIGPGSGILALAAAKRGAQVVAVDINPTAVECARANARRNRLSERVEVREGDMFAPLGDERFDVIMSNPPYFRGEPQSWHERALKAGPELEWITRFAAGAGRFLAPNGRLLIVLGDAAEVGEILAIFADHGWRRKQIAQRDLVHEILRVFELWPATEQMAPEVTNR